MIYNNWYAMTDQALTEHLGKFIKDMRVHANYSQTDLAKEAGVSRPTVIALEKGEPVTTTTLIRVLRILQQLHLLGHFTYEEPVSPMLLAERELMKPKRVRGKKPGNNTSYVDW
jgi:putative transcriptional regulator